MKHMLVLSGKVKDVRAALQALVAQFGGDAAIRDVIRSRDG